MHKSAHKIYPRGVGVLGAAFLQQSTPNPWPRSYFFDRYTSNFCALRCRKAAPKTPTALGKMKPQNLRFCICIISTIRKMARVFWDILKILFEKISDFSEAAKIPLKSGLQKMTIFDQKSRTSRVLAKKRVIFERGQKWLKMAILTKNPIAAAF